MSRAPTLFRRFRNLGVLALSALLAGCVTYPNSYYQNAYPYGDGYAGDYYYGESYDPYYGNGYYNGWYGGYYSALWPLWYNYYYPWYPYGYYGVSYFPYDWYGLSLGYHWGHHGHGGYHHYSPYRNSWSDNEWYGGTDWRNDPGDAQGTPRFGSARNEAERLSQLQRTQLGATAKPGPGGVSAQAGNGTDELRRTRPVSQPGAWSRARDGGGTGMPAGASYNPRYGTNSRGMIQGQQGTYQRGNSGPVAGMPARGARGGLYAPVPADAQHQQQYRHMPGVPGYQPSAPAAGQAQGAQSYSRGRDGGVVGGHQPAPQTMHVAPSPSYSAPSGGTGHGGSSGSSRGDSGGSWSRGRDDGGQPD